MNCSPNVGLKNQFRLSGSSFMFKGSSLSEEQREAAVALFATGWGSRAAASKLGVGRKAVLRLHDSGIVVLFPLGGGRAFA
jgi:hypothetical protein